MGGDLHFSQIEDIVQQLNVFGAKGVVDLKGRLTEFVPYLFNIDKAIPEDLIRMVADHNKGVKINEGALRRQQAALAASDALEAQISQPVQTFEVEMEQLEVSENDESSIAEGLSLIHI